MNAVTPQNPQNSMNHVDEVTGLLYIEGQLEQVDARVVVVHLEQCAACRRLLDALKRESLLLSQALVEDDEPLPARLLAPRRSEGLSWGWLTAFALAGLGAYTLWSSYVDPWMDNIQQSGFGGQFIFTWLLLNGAFWKGWNDMLQFVVLISLGVLASILLLLFRRNLRRLASLSIFLAVLVPLGLAHPPSAQAATEFIKQEVSYEIPVGQTVKHDLFILGPSVRIDGTLDGDLVCMCHSLSVDGHVTGDVIAFANSARITGKVDGNVRSFNQHLVIEGVVARNVLSFVGQFETTPRSNVAGSATLFVGDMRLDGPIGRDLSAYLGDGSINAPIGGDVKIHGGAEEHERHGPLVVASHADIKGSFRYRGPFQPEISADAKLSGSPLIEIVRERPEYLRSSGYWYNAMIWGMAFVIGLLFVSLAPDFVHQTSRQVARIGAPLGVGLVAFFALPVVAFIACVTVVGLGLGISTLFFWLFMIFFGQVFTAVWMGEAMLGAASGALPMTGRLALGLLVLRLAALVPVLGFFVRFFSSVLGLGAIALLIFRHFQHPTAPPVAAPVAPAPAA